jgi:hypothetical protein
MAVGPEHLTDLVEHAAIVPKLVKEIVAEDRVRDPVDAKGAEVIAAFQPDRPQELIQSLQGRLGLHLEIQPEDRGLGALHAQVEDPAGPSRRCVVRRSTRAHVPDHRRLAAPVSAQRTGSR